MYKKAIVAFIVILTLIVISNIYIGKSVTSIKEATKDAATPKATAKKSSKSKPAIKKSPQEKKSNALSTQEELSKYGIVLSPKESTPTSVSNWEMHLEKNFKKHKVLESKEAQEAMDNMTITKEQYDQNMKDLDEHIGMAEKKVHEDPFDKNKKQQLENLYKLKAVSTVLENRVTKEGATVPDFVEKTR